MAWKIGSFLGRGLGKTWRLFSRFLTALGLSVFIAGVGGAIVGWKISGSGPVVAEKTFLVLSLDRAIPGKKGIDLPGAKRPATVSEIVFALDRAKDDPRVLGVVAEIGAGVLTIAQAQEIGDAVEAFAGSGKSTYAFSEDLGSFWNGTTDYLLASRFDELWLQPSGGVGLNGFAIEAPFYKDALDKIGIVAQVEQRHEYKNAADSLDESSMPDAMREIYGRLLASWTKQSAGMLEARGVDRERFVETVLDGGPYLADEALERGIVDRLAYRHELAGFVDERLGDDGVRISPVDYLHAVSVEDDDAQEGPSIALVYGIGSITSENKADAVRDGFNAYGVLAGLEKAIEDDEIAAVVFRVDSPGGAYGQSDMIWSAVRRLREAGKPVVVSMGTAAGSGGYFVSMAADYIFALPGTITGSIGVYAVKPALEEFWSKIGVNWGRVEVGKNVGVTSIVSPLSESQKARFADWMDATYLDFTTKVGADRGLSQDEVDAVARGRIWSGLDAVDLGLVDENGGILAAIDKAKELAGLDVGADYPLVILPEKPDPLEQLAEVLGLVRRGALISDSQDPLTSVETIQETMLQLTGLDSGGVLSMPPFRVAR